MSTRKQDLPRYPSARNLYLFMREILGPDISDNEIARRWKVDARIFNDIKHGRVAVPRLERLRELAGVLGVNEHFVYAAGAGVPLRQLLVMVRRQDISTALASLVGATVRAEEALADSHRQLKRMESELQLKNVHMQALLEQLWVAVLTFDTQGNIVHLNPLARDMFGIEADHPGVPMAVLLNGTVFLDLEGRPFDASELPGPHAVRTKTVTRKVFSIHRPGRKGRIVAGTATPMRSGKRFIGVVSVVRDVEDILSSVGGLGDLPTHPRFRRAAASKKKSSARKKD